jgi:hypothetical protein
MRYLTLATDYDGTIATQGRASATALHAIARLRASGRRAILVTGRRLDELLTVLPQSGCRIKLLYSSFHLTGCFANEPSVLSRRTAVTASLLTTYGLRHAEGEIYRDKVCGTAGS